MFTVRLVNFDVIYKMPTLAEAKKWAEECGFEAAVYGPDREDNEWGYIGTYSPIGGWR